jgi:transient receptor potential cation channel subfamily M protein 2
MFKASRISLNAIFMAIGGQRPYTTLSENEGKTLDKHHSHFLLLDDGHLGGYLSDDPRSDFVKNMREVTKCYTMTIIVEGGFHTLEVIINDLKANRPVIIIQGSGRLADILGTLLENTSDDKTPE